MVCFPNCKINLGLHILRKRDDGFHDIETVFYPVPLYDVLEVIHDHQNGPGILFTQTGLTISGTIPDNICVKAYQLLKKDLPELPPVNMHLHKVIPMGAGLGGGSADGAFALSLLNDTFQLNIPEKTLSQYASLLGSDCPFFIINKPCFAGGRGEMLEEIAISLSGYTIILINPGIHVDTGWAFSRVSPSLSQNDTRDIVRMSPDKWKGVLENDFEGPVFEKYPEIKDIKEALYNKGAVYAAMSGSGSTVFGIFEKDITEKLFPGTNYFEYKTR